MHSPSRVQIPPSPRMTPALRSKCGGFRILWLSGRGAIRCYAVYLGYRTKRVGFMVTFRLFGAEKSVLKLVGANLKDGQNVLVL